MLEAISVPRYRGFTLIELMIAVAIVGILAAVAYPSYVDHVRDSRRAEAQRHLMENAQFMERNYTVAGAYNEDESGNSVDTSDLPITDSPPDGTTFYEITLDSVDASSFELLATAQGDQTNDACGDLTLDQTGQWTHSKTDSSNSCRGEKK